MRCKRIVQVGLVGVSLALAALGCWFCWNCPMDWLYGPNQHSVFVRQLAWNALGLAAFAAATTVRWTWWRKSAPWLLALWALLAFYAIAFGRPVNGSYRWADLGFLRVNVRTLFVVVSALFVAWLCSKKGVRPWMVYAAVGLFVGFFGCRVAMDEARLARLLSFAEQGEAALRGSWMHCQLKAAFGAANWFGNAGLDCRFLPNALGDGMASASALAFGKWFPIAVFALFAALSGLLTSVWLRVKDASKRMFVLFWGVGMVLPAVYGFFQCVGFVPVRGFSPVLAGYGGTGAVVFWLGLAIVLAIVREEDEAPSAGKGGVVNAVVWGGLFAAFSLGAVLASGTDLKFAEPPLRRSDCGEFGTQAKRGDILAADGTALARSYEAIQVYLDPKVARMEAWASPQECYRTVAEVLGLQEGLVSNQYARTNSRFIKLVDEATAEMVGECRRPRMSRRSGLVLVPEQRRSYPLGTNASHVVGCVRRPVEEKPLGCTGLEYTYDSTLAGMNGVRNTSLKLSEQRVLGRPTNGGDVVTTIVPSLQVALAETLVAAAAKSGAETGWGVVLKIPTGEISALASVPAYDPVRRDANPDGSYLNNATQRLFEPGGLMKPITYAMAMEDESWTNRFERELPRFGLGRKVGGGTLYGESAGIPYRRNRYDPVSISRLGMGRCTAVTGIQMANAFAVFANDGVEVLPHLVSRTTDADGKTAFAFLPAVSTNRIVSSETARKMTRMMEEAFKAAASESGADLGGVRVAGAVTETALPENGVYSPTNFNVAAVGFLPADRPAYVVGIGFQKPKSDHSAGRVALPAFAEVVRKLKAEMPACETGGERSK